MTVNNLEELPKMWITTVLSERQSNRVFGLRNKSIHHLLTPHFFVWFVELNELIHHHLIPHN
jgi:hypothetical protein